MVGAIAGAFLSVLTRSPLPVGFPGTKSLRGRDTRSRFFSSSTRFLARIDSSWRQSRDRVDARRAFLPRRFPAPRKSDDSSRVYSSDYACVRRGIFADPL